MAVGGGDDHEVVLVGEQVVGRREDVGVRVRGARLRHPLRVGGDDRRQRQARNGLDQRRVERRPGEAVANQADP
jgi:hypothetical protein